MGRAVGVRLPSPPPPSGMDSEGSTRKGIRKMLNAPSTIDNTTATMEAVLENLARLGGRFSREDDIVFKGRQYILPENQPFDVSVDFLNKRLRDEEEEYQYQRTFAYLPWDGAVAVGTAMRELFGALVGKKIKTPFGDIPPSFIDIQTGVGQFTQAPWGQVVLPWDSGGYLNVGATRNEHGDVVFHLSAQTKRKYRDEIDGFFNYVETVLAERSIYRGKAITASEKPEFIDVSKVDPDDVVYTEAVMQELGTHIWLNIRRPDSLRREGQSMKRLVILHGTYGTGKTLAAYLTGRECVVAADAIWAEARKAELINKVLLRNLTTFIIVRPGIDTWERALTIARCYGKSIIFVEDVDTLMKPEDPEAISRMLEQTDGLTSKGIELQVVWTTNHLKKIPMPMLRPGRTDALVEIGFMDRPGVERLTRRVVRNLAPDVDFDKVFEAMDGYTPAYVREALDRSVRYSLFQHDGELGEIDTDALVGAAEGLRPQLQIMADATEGIARAGVDGALGDLMTEQLRRHVAQLVDDVVETRIDGAHLISEASGDAKFRIATN